MRIGSVHLFQRKAVAQEPVDRVAQMVLARVGEVNDSQQRLQVHTGQYFPYPPSQAHDQMVVLLTPKCLGPTTEEREGIVRTVLTDLETSGFGIEDIVLYSSAITGKFSGRPIPAESSAPNPFIALVVRNLGAEALSWKQMLDLPQRVQNPGAKISSGPFAGMADVYNWRMQISLSETHIGRIFETYRWGGSLVNIEGNPVLRGERLFDRTRGMSTSRAIGFISEVFLADSVSREVL